MGLINSLANRAYSISFLSVSMTSEITYEGGGACLLSDNRISGLITANVPPLTYHCKQGDSQASILHCVHTIVIERFQNCSIAVVSYTGCRLRHPLGHYSS